MASLNKVFLIGNLTRDPDLRYTPGGAAVCELGLAVNRRFTVNNQEREEVCFVDVTVWSKSAENCKRFLEKGAPVMVEGRLQLDTWEDRDGGGKRSKLRVVAEQIQFLSARRDGSAPDGGGAYGAPDNSGNSYAGNNSSRPQNQNYGGGNGNGGGNYEPRPYGRNQPPQDGGGQSGAPYGAPPPPPMPKDAFNPGTEAEEDIPF